MHTRFPSAVLSAIALIGLGATFAPSSAHAQEASCPCYPAVTDITTECQAMPPVLEQGQVTAVEEFRINIDYPSHYWRYVCPADPAVQSERAGNTFFELVTAMDTEKHPWASSCHRYTYDDKSGDSNLTESGFDADTANACWNVIRDAAHTMGATAPLSNP